MFKIDEYSKIIKNTNSVREIGKVIEIIGLVIEADGPQASIGDLCYIYNKLDEEPVWAEVVLSSILDLYSRDIISYTISVRPLLSMIMEMLYQAFAQIHDGFNLILHSDQGWQYQHKHYQAMLKSNGVSQCMSRKGNCLDNAVMENFFGLLKSELLYLQYFDSMGHFKAELINYMDYYNNRRIKVKLKGLSPAIHRQQALAFAL